MKEFKALSESHLELLDVKLKQVQILISQITQLQDKNQQRIERMKLEIGIPAEEIGKWSLSKDGKGFEREKEIKKTFPNDKKRDKKISG